MVQLRVNDIKQYAYCPRVVFYDHVMPVDKAATFKMSRGHAAEARIDDLEKRRGLSRYGLDKGERRFHVPVFSERLGLGGKIDMLIETRESAIPVDFKMTQADVQPNHLLQLCGYALILEDMTGKPVPRGFVYRIPAEEAHEVVFNEELRRETQAAIENIRRMIEREEMPPPTESRARCEGCEFRNYCGDVF